jgi:rSAM/selenodomain-associated transferase 1
MEPTTSADDALVIFARAPVLGRVKPRLAAAVGDARALDIYRELAETVVALVGDTAATVVVAHDPPDSGEVMRSWLGPRLRYEPQVPGDLGARMSSAVSRRLREGARRVIVIGTDCPALSADVVARAFEALERADVVLGPAEDGGYYLVGTRAAHPALFDEIPWSSPHTLAVTLERLAGAGLRVQRLEVLRDVDTLEDWRAYESTRRSDGG